MTKMKEDRGESQRLRLQEMFFVTFFRLLQAARIHQANNDVAKKICSEFKQVADKYAENEPVVTLQLTAGRFYLQKEKFRYRRDMANLVTKAIQYFKERQLHGIEFLVPLGSQDNTGLFEVATLFNQAARNKNPSQWLENILKEKEVGWLNIMPKPLSNRKAVGLLGGLSIEAGEGAEEGGDGEGDGPHKGYAAQQSYAQVLSSLKGVTTKISADHPTSMRETVRVVQSMVDLLVADSSVLIGLSTLRDYDDYTYTHSVNVSILAMSLGLQAGLSRESLEMLGICGLFHDLGKVSIPHEIINKPGKLNDAEFAEIQKHTFYSVSQIIKLPIARDVRARIILPPFEHHLKFDLSGYPRTSRNRPISLFGRILAIADVYDAITSPRVYREYTMSPDRALGWMMERGGKDFDPLLLKVFVSMLGVYPPGTLVRLDTGETGLVKSFEGERPLDRPTVVLLETTDDGNFTKSDEVDLDEKDNATGKYLRSVVAGYSAGDYGIQPAEFTM